MNQIRFACPQCDQKFKVASSKAGLNTKCPKCETRITVPTSEPGAPRSVEPRSETSYTVPLPAKSTPPKRSEASPRTAAENDASNQGFPEQAQTDTSVFLRVLYPGRFFLFDVRVPLTLDSQPSGDGYVKKGIDTTIPTTLGEHRLKVGIAHKMTEYFLVLDQPGTWTIRLKYSSSKGGFDDNFILVDPSSEEASTADPYAFNCRVIQSGALGHEKSLGLPISGPPFRDAIVRIQHDRLCVKARASGGELHLISEVDGKHVLSVTTKPYGYMDVLKQVSAKFFSAAIRGSAIITVGGFIIVLFKIGFGIPMPVLLMMPVVGITIGTILAALLVLLPSISAASRFPTSVAVEIDTRSGKSTIIVESECMQTALEHLERLSGLDDITRE